MQRIDSKLMIETAYKEGRAVAAMNVSNMETIAAVLGAASSLNQPVLLQVSPLQRYAHGFSYKRIVRIIEAVAADLAGGSYAIHLDHSESLTECAEALDGGFDSLMLDGGALPFEENVAAVAAVRKICRKALEGELGVVGGGEAGSIDIAMRFTNPALAEEFVRRTGVDWLAVAIGNSHGVYKGEPKLDFELLEQLHHTLDIPLVLHGASGIPGTDLRKAITLGVAKINFFTELDLAFREGVRSELDKNSYMMFIAQRAQQSVQEKAVEILTVCANG